LLPKTPKPLIYYDLIFQTYFNNELCYAIAYSGTFETVYKSLY